MCAVQYSNRGIRLEKLGRAFVEHYRRDRWEQGRTQTLVTHSMGLPLALGAIANVVEKGQGDVNEKRAAWVRARDAVNEPAAKGLAEARIAAYDAAITREKAHEAVRRRIVERDVAREAAAGQ